MQDELRQTLSRLLPPPAAIVAPTVEVAPTAIPPTAINPPIEDAPPTNNNNVTG